TLPPSAPPVVASPKQAKARRAASAPADAAALLSPPTSTTSFPFILQPAARGPPSPSSPPSPLPASRRIAVGTLRYQDDEVGAGVLLDGRAAPYAAFYRRLLVHLGLARATHFYGRGSEPLTLGHFADYLWVATQSPE